MIELLNKLQTFESISKEKRHKTNIIEANALKAQSFSKNNKQKRKTGGKYKLAGEGKFKRNKNNKDNSKKSKRKCFYYSIDGH